MEEVRTLEQACELSLATINGILADDERFKREKKQLFTHLKLLTQLAKRLEYSIALSVPQYCSTCGLTSELGAAVSIGCGGGCFTCSHNCFYTKYQCESFNKKFCFVCGNPIDPAFISSVRVAMGQPPN